MFDEIMGIPDEATDPKFLSNRIGKAGGAIGVALHATEDSGEAAVGGITSLRQGFDRVFV